MESFPSSQGGPVVFDLIKTIQQNAAYLSEIDGAIGDGDHGVNMNKGFTRAGQLLGSGEVDLSSGLGKLGQVLLTEIGGAMGPLYGTFFMEMARACKNHPDVDAQLFQQMLQAGLEGVRDLGGAQPGDKTLLDTLAPASESFAAAVSEGASFHQALARMVEAAERGKDSTRDMVAKVGRASRLGERSRGVLDAGATSCYLIVKSMADSIARLLAGQADAPASPP